METEQKGKRAPKVGIVIDVIVDENHPIFTGHPVEKEWIGKALIRIDGDKEWLHWAYPSNVSASYPAVEDKVIITMRGKKMIYSLTPHRG